MTASTVELRPLTKQNWEAAANLTLADDQREFIAENVWTIAETQFFPWVERRVIVVGDEVVGLAAYGRDHDGGAWWLYRFMVGAAHQRRGYGRAALAALVAEWRARKVARVTVGFHQRNAVAERLYQTAGFVPGPDAEWGEKTATLTL